MESCLNQEETECHQSGELFFTGFSRKRLSLVCLPSGGRIILMWGEFASDIAQIFFKFNTPGAECKVLIVKNINMF